MFDKLKFEPHESFAATEVGRYEFPNGYGVSVVRGPLTYGYPDLYEMAFTRDLTGMGHTICTVRVPHHDGQGPVIIDDVMGWLTPDLVSHYMNEVSKIDVH